jgi:gliding motility-associated lipoprotein GldH
MMHRALVVWISVCLICLSACDPARVYEQNIDFQDSSWAVDETPVFEFEIQDINQQYDVFFNARYNLQYNFYNLYIQHQLIGPDSSLVSANLHQLLLMDPKTGKPLGKGFSDTYDLQARAIKGIRFPQAGTYRIKLTQYMRKDPLPDILAVGIRVSKHKND